MALETTALRIKPVQKQTSYREVFLQLEEAILSGDFPLGKPIPTEAKLCELFEVKRSTVREGVRLLEESGLVKRNSARRLVATAPNIEMISNGLTRSIMLNGVSLEEIWCVQRNLEVLSSNLICENVTPEIIENLEQNLSETIAVKHDLPNLVELDAKFHHLISRGSNNYVLNIYRDLFSILLFSVSEGMMEQLPQSTDRHIAAHQEILNAIKTKDGDKASLWMQKHINDFKAGCEMVDIDFSAPVSTFINPARLLEITRAT